LIDLRCDQSRPVTGLYSCR